MSTHAAWYLEIMSREHASLHGPGRIGRWRCILALGGRGPATMHVSEAMHTYTVPILDQRIHIVIMPL